MNPFLFLVGCPRSGTTLLRVMLDSHPRLAIPPESHFIAKWAAQPERFGAAGAFDASRFLNAILVHKWFALCELDEAAVRRHFAHATPATFSDAVRSLYACYAQTRGKVRWGDKTPAYVRHVGALATLFDEARFVHIVRDGRDVAASLIKQAWGPDNVHSAALFWKRSILSARRDGESIGSSRYCEIRYEDLVSQPQEQLETIGRFAGLDFDPAMLRHFEFERPMRATKLDSLARPAAPKSLDFRALLTSDDVRLFERVAGDVLEGCGYETVAGRPSPAERATLGTRLLGSQVRRGLRRAAPASLRRQG